MRSAGTGAPAGAQRPGVAVVGFDRDSASFLALGVRQLRIALAREGAAEPVELADLEAMALEAMAGRAELTVSLSWPGADTSAGVGDDQADEWLDLSSVAEVTGISTRTLRRRIADGQLTAVKVGRRLVRVHRDELRRFMGRAA